jgi:type II secretory pathway component PulF
MMTWEFVLLLLVPLILVVTGLAILWARGRAAARFDERSAPSAWGAVGWPALAWTLLLLGIIGGIVLMTAGTALVLLPVVAILLVGAIARYQDGERQSLLRVLLVAAERGIPLEAAANAFANERNDVSGMRARLLADYLEAGMPLGQALKRSRNRVPPAALLAADLGQQTGALGAALRQVVDQADETEGTLRSTLEKFFYLAMVGAFALAVLAFVMVKIIPVFCKMFQDFGMQLPALTLGLITACRDFGPAAAVMLVCILAVLLILAVAGYVRLSPRYLPIVRQLWWRADCALVLRWLALAVRQNRPLAERVRELAGCFPHWSIRRRLARAAQWIDGGGDWCTGLRRTGLIRGAEAAVFQAAERAGNLAWALDEMANSNIRRLTYRLRAWLNVLFPLLVLVFGGCVLVIGVGILQPLFQLIASLS